MTFIPQEKLYVKKEIEETLRHSVDKNLPALLIGETGVGKTAFIRELAKKEGKTLIRINLTGQTGVDEFVGKYLANENGTYWVNGLLTTALEKGYWVVLDEVNMALPEILAKLHSLLDDDRQIVLNEKEGEIVKPHKDFRFFATMNPSEEYAGTKELNKAFLSRFPVVLDIEWSPDEQQILQDRANIDKDTAEKLVVLAREIRNQKENGKLNFTVSTRDLIYCAQMIENGQKIEQAIETTILNKAHKDEREAIAKLITLITDGQIKIGKTTVKYKSITEVIEKADQVARELEKWKENSKKKDKEIEMLMDTIRTHERVRLRADNIDL